MLGLIYYARNYLPMLRNYLPRLRNFLCFNRFLFALSQIVCLYNRKRQTHLAYSLQVVWSISVEPRFFSLLESIILVKYLQAAWSISALLQKRNDEHAKYNFDKIHS